MATRTPSAQERSQQQPYWGRYSYDVSGTPPAAYLGRSAGLGSQGLPNAPNNVLPLAEFEKLEAGDIAATSGATGFEYGLWTCIYPGTVGGGDAVWIRDDDPPGGAGPVDLSLTGLITGTSPLVVGAVYLIAGRALTPSSRALIGVQTTGTATLRLREQTSGVLFAGAQWDRAATLGDATLPVEVTVPTTDWYTIELLGDDPATTAQAFGLQLI